MRFAGKHGIVHEVRITDSAPQADLQALPGAAGADAVPISRRDGEPRPVTSGDVNDYIKRATGGDFTAKHFRTWGASVIASSKCWKKRKTRGSASRR